MAEQLYTFSRTDNNYFNGHDLHVTWQDTGEVITVNRKDGMLAVSVKDEETIHAEPAPVQEAAHKLGDDGVSVVYDRAREGYWIWAHMDLAGNHGFDGVSAEGRSGGWLAVFGTETIEDDEITETPAPGSPWARFLALAFEAVAEIETYREQFRAELGEAAAGLSEAHNEAARIRAASEPIKVFLVAEVGDGGQLVTNLYRNKLVLMGRAGSHFEGAATQALSEPGEAILLNEAETTTETFVTYLTVVE